MNERQTAFKVLNKIERDNAYTNLALDAALRDNTGAPASSSFVTALVYGVTERKITLDYILSKYLTKPIKKLKPEVLTILRMGLYQIKFMDKVPVSAAVNESVKLAKCNKSAFAAGLINSVLRKAADEQTVYPETDDVADDLSIRYSCPKELVQRFISDYGEENAKCILSSSIGCRPLTARVNTLKITPSKLSDMLKSEGIHTSCIDGSQGYIQLKETGAVEKLQAYKNGFFHVQDTACGKAVVALNLTPGETFIDMCSSPGGKAFTAAEIMQNSGEIIAFDLYPQRVNLISSGAKRLGIDIIKAVAADSSVFLPELENKADKVLCDVPCSGFGIIGKKPEIRYKDLSIIDNLVPVQYNILANASKYVKNGGILVYSTCTLNREENEGVCERFIENNQNFKKISYNTLMPHIDGGDGFFFAVFGRK